MDCFVAEFIIGPAEGGTRWLLAMTARCQYAQDALTPRAGCAKLGQTNIKTPEERHAPCRGQQIPDRKRCGDGDGRVAAPVLAACASVGRIAGSRRAAEEDR